MIIDAIEIPDDFVPKLMAASHGAYQSYVVEAVLERIERDQNAEADWDSMCDPAAMDISYWEPAQRRAMSLGG